VRLGTYVLVLPYYDPRKLAEESAMLDLLSGGRFTLGVGRGGSWETDILRACGVPPAMRTARFTENLRVIDALWRGEPVTTKAAGLDYDNATIFVRPMQQPRPPVWIGAMADAAIVRAAEQGDAWAVDPFPIEIDSWKRRVAMYREAAARAGKKGQIVLMRDGFIADTRAEAERVYGSVVVEEYLQYWDWGLFAHVPGFESRSAVNIENLSRHMAIGTADDCLADLQRCREEYGVDYVVLCSRRPAGPASSQVVESIRGFGSDVLPRLGR
jgi:alkanesulfonate monooxygenase SsuD/methylene tetrahydromethanopterin reductase-like flavin-dependent oxidoreductase (luciferase family)